METLWSENIMQKDVVGEPLFKSNHSTGNVNVNYQWKFLPWVILRITDSLESIPPTS